MAGSGLHGAAPKVVQIDTHYVQTDAVNFKHVVQSFTGKNSSTAWIGEHSYDVVMEGSSDIKGGTSDLSPKPEEDAAVVVTFPSMLMNNMGYNEFNMLLLELPPMEMENRPWF